MRAGTSWLSRILDSRTDCRMTPVKELHFFDLRYGKYSGKVHYRSLARWLRQRSLAMSKRMHEMFESADTEQTHHDRPKQEMDVSSPHSGATGWSDSERRQFFARARLGKALPQFSDIVDTFFLRDVDSYVKYVRRETLGVNAFGEITPAYSLLPAAAFAEINKALPGVHFIFIMRDPVERLWSQVRFRAGMAAMRHQKQLDPGVLFDKALQNSGATGRSNYHRTIEELESVIPADQILYFFYETVTSPETGPAEIRRLEDALGLQPAAVAPGLFNRPVNASPPASLSREQVAAAVEYFQPVYDFVELRFGKQPGWRFASATASHVVETQS